MSEPLRIKDYIRNEWASYADYDNRRSLPHIMDGLKITQRKALYTATQLPKGDKPVRVSQFASKAAELTAYHHGEKSMLDAVVKLAQDYPGSNNFPWLERHGQFGSRLSNESAAGRYIFTKLHKNWDTFFHKKDQDVVDYWVDDGNQIEPKFFIPILPTLLLNGSSGTGNGFKSKILNYNVSDVAKACREVTKYGKVKTPLIPHINGWTGTIEKVDRQVILSGTIEVIHSTKLRISELPPKYDNEKFKAVLNNLIEKDLIKDYENRSTEDAWDWIIHLRRTTTALPMDKLMSMFKLVEKTTENFVGWGIDASVPLTFDGPEALVEYWCAERLKLYQKSIDQQIVDCKADIVRADLKARFIKWCLKNDFRKLTRKEFIDNSVAGVKSLTPEIAGEFVTMPMYRITTDEVDKLNADIDALMDAMDVLEQLTPATLMEQNLKGL
ncbi:DNA topoisomerase II medium subunit [Xanthomonas phage Xoo-sp13]|nr:DNA topoisomerase II medium subunit [Xanthomonas phage Xoo-sp13]